MVLQVLMVKSSVAELASLCFASRKVERTINRQGWAHCRWSCTTAYLTNGSSWTQTNWRLSPCKRSWRPRASTREPSTWSVRRTVPSALRSSRFHRAFSCSRFDFAALKEAESSWTGHLSCFSCSATLSLVLYGCLS